MLENSLKAPNVGGSFWTPQAPPKQGCPISTTNVSKPELQTIIWKQQHAEPIEFIGRAETVALRTL